MTEEQHLQKGFNAGYLLAREKPVLAEMLKKGFVDKDAPYAAGFIAGAREYEKEKAKSRTRNYRVKPTNKTGRDKTKDRDKGERDI